MNKYPEQHMLLKMIQKEIENVNCTPSIKKIECVFKNLS